MKKARIADLKARLSEYLRYVRNGHTVTVLDRQTPIARLIPYTLEPEVLPTHKPVPGTPRLQEIRLPKPLKTDIDIVDLLIEERQGER